MLLTHGAQKVETLNGKRIVKSSAVGKSNVEEIKWLTNSLLAASAPWKALGWGYIVDITKMDPVDPEVSMELVNLHKALATSGCRAMAFVEGGAFFLAAQAKQHQKQSKSAVLEGHFPTEAEAVKWLNTIIK